MSPLAGARPPFIFSYSRAQAIDDNVLIDVSEMATEAGFRFPVAMTAAVWAEFVQVPENVSCQDEAGRLWDILWMLSVAICRTTDPSPVLFFELVVRNDDTKSPQPVQLKSICGPGDHGEPVITVMFPHED